MEQQAELEQLRRLLQEAQRDREEAQRGREEERRRREEAEEQARRSSPLTLQEYLEACHDLHLAMQVVTDRSLTTQGDTTNPTGRIFPRRIIPWGEDFAIQQEKIWNDLSVSTSFCSVPTFPSQHQLEYVKSMLQPISSELGVRNFERDAIENAVQTLVQRALADPLLRSSLKLQGTVTFDSHTNLGSTDSDSISGHIEHMSLSTGSASMSKSALRGPASKARRRGRGKGNRADQFCIYRTSDDRNTPALAIEFKAPHKLSVDEIVTGLESEIQPERDVINKDGQDFAFSSKALSAAVITQLFSYMIGKGIRYGYVCTGPAFIFLYIPDDPSIVYFSVCVPSLDVKDDDETWLHRTAVAQVFAFILQALRATPPPQSWHDEAEKLDTWAVEYDDILKAIPATVRKSKKRVSLYKPQRWKGFTRSPIRTRSRCHPSGTSVGRLEHDDDEDPPSPTPNPGRSSKNAVLSAASGSRGGGGQGARQGNQSDHSQATKPNIQSRPFCTVNCLLGLAYGGPIDKKCPNSDLHGPAHIRRREFLALVRTQLATDRGNDADCAPLHLSGARGSLFKVRLSAYGYTLVAKGVESIDRIHLRHENKIYNQLKTIQGKHVPVCLGSINLELPYYYNSGVYNHFMLLSWAGRPLFNCINQIPQADEPIKEVTKIFNAIHQLGVLHHDVAVRNILYDADRRTFVVVDFERAEFRPRYPLSSIGLNSQCQKRKRRGALKEGKDDFARELESAVVNISKFAMHREVPMASQLYHN
ncbi:hypothetical protein jhhlp_002918 [Lomentospora prolificans]|uniref:non-specific serine/threonine protein kinase n=1 Tax=Lomentospora prolificans TaxID=41688 RepID=A0A2N3NFI6_9PEZI|nr:hypothetical protein jhhlp_002918 [Lomentospora prolificans]